MIALATITLITAIGAATSQARIAGLSPIETQWVRRIIPLTDSMGVFNGEIARDSQNPDVLKRGSDTQLQLVVALAGLQSCTPTLARKGSPPPRLLPFRNALAAACKAYGRAARLIATGIDRLDAARLRAGAAAMQLGVDYTNRATAALLALR